jgi:hypothetical protein
MNPSVRLLSSELLGQALNLSLLESAEDRHGFTHLLFNQRVKNLLDVLVRVIWRFHAPEIFIGRDRPEKGPQFVRILKMHRHR